MGQDEGFFVKVPDLLDTLRLEPMNEKTALRRLEGFRPLLKREVEIDSFLLDDGWDDPRTLWDFDYEKFPDGFEPLAEKAKKMGAGLSVWLSPWGGYGQAKDDRVRLAQKQGFEVNDHGLSLAGPKYAARFRSAVLEFRRHSRVNMFKFDGVAGDAETLSAEVEAMLGICAAIRTDSLSKEKAGKGKETQAERKQRKKRDAFWINLTTGTWPSPFFLLWVDSIWRGMTDTMIPKWPAIDGLTYRQKWQVWRECVVSVLVVDRAELFPISRLMVHGVILAGHGDALANQLHLMERYDWAQEVWSLAAMGLQLQELYISAKFMTKWAWDELAAALRWARSNWEILEDAHWAIPTTCFAASEEKTADLKPYAVAAYRSATPTGMLEANASTGFVFFRNPRNKRQLSPSYSLSSLLELPKKLANSLVTVSLIRQVSASVSKESGGILDCNAFGGVERLSSGKCEVAVDARLKLVMSAGEVLVLRVDVPATRAANTRVEL